MARLRWDTLVVWLIQSKSIVYILISWIVVDITNYYGMDIQTKKVRDGHLNAW